MAFVYVQRILDLNLNAFVRYETLVPTASPVASETVPVSTGVYDTATHEILASYDDPSKSAGGGGGAGVMVWRPTATDAGNVYGSWGSVYAALTLAHGATTVVVDTSLVQGNIYPANAATIPVGTWNLPNVTFVGVPVTEGGTTEKAILLLSSSVLAGVQDLAFENLRVYWETTASDLIGNTAGPVRVSMKNVDLDSPSNTSTHRLFFVSGATPSHTLELRLDNFTQLDTNTSTEVVNAGAATTIDIFVSGYTKFSATATFMSDTPTTTWNVYIDTAAEVTNRAALQAASAGTVTTVYRTEAGNVQYNDAALPVFGSSNVQGALDYVKSQLGNGERNFFVYGSTATVGKNVYDTWASLYAALSAIPGPKTVYLDTAHNGGTPLLFTIPAGTYNLSGWTFIGPGNGTPCTLALANGAIITGSWFEFCDVEVYTQATSVGNIPWNLSGTCSMYLRGAASIGSNGTQPSVYIQAGEPSGSLFLSMHDVTKVTAPLGSPTILLHGGVLTVNLYDGALIDANSVGSDQSASVATIAFASPGALAPLTNGGTYWTTGTYNVEKWATANLVSYNDNAVDFPLGAADVQAAIDSLKNVPLATTEPTGFMYPGVVDLTFTPGTRTLTLTPAVTSYDVYVGGIKFTKTGDSITWTNVEGLHLFYYDGTGTLQHQEGITNIADILAASAIVSILYWDATNSVIVYEADERHGTVMDSATHIHMHLSMGTQWISGLALTVSPDQAGGSDADSEVAVASGVIRDEDLEHVIVSGSPQTLTPIAQLPVLYRTGSGGYWRMKTADNFPFIYPGTAGYSGTRPAYNQYTGGSWQFTEVTNNDFFLAHIVATNDFRYPVVAVAGTNVYTTVGDARSGANTEAASLVLTDLFAEFSILGTIIYQTSNSYTNTTKTRVRSTADGASYVDFRTKHGIVAQAASVHGNLSGLSADDHTQYILVAGTRAFTGDQSMGSHKLTNVSTPTVSTDAATKGYVDGVVVTSHSALTNLTADDHLQYLRTDGTRALTGDLSAGSHKITNLTDPASAQDAATKAYVDAVAQGLDVKNSVVVATTGPITLSSLQTIDGHTLTAGERVLVKDQSTASENGIYDAAAGSWSRSSDANTSAKVTSGLFVYTVLGTANATKGFVLTTPDPIVLNTTALTFTQFSGSGVTSHASLTGLTADDHPQYLRTDGTRALTGNQSANGFKITSLATPTATADAATKGYVDGLPQVVTEIYFSPSNPTPGAGVVTTWTALQAALTAAGQWTPKRVHVDGQYVGYAITVPSGITHVWDMVEFIGDISTLTFAQGCLISSFWGVSFKDLVLTSAATSGTCAFTSYVSGYSGIPVTFKGGTTYVYGGGSGTLPLFDITTGTDSVSFMMENTTYMLENVTACVRVSGGTAYFNCGGNASLGSGSISSSNAASTATIEVAAEYGSRIGSAAFTSTLHPAWTLGTITFTLGATAPMVAFTPTGNIAATTVSAALAELDTEKVAGPGVVTDRAIVTYNGTGGVTIRDNANATVDASGNIQAPKLGAGVAPTYQLDASTGAAGTTAVARLATTSGTSKVFVYNSTPEGVVTGSVGDLCVDATNGYMYQKRTGTGNTGWVQFAAASSSSGIYRITAGLNYQVVTGYTGLDLVVGGFAYQPGSDTPIKFEAAGSFSGNFTAYLYDVGSPSGGSTPALRATLPVTVSSGYGAAVMTLTPVAVPSTNGQISTSERLYEVRINATTAGVLMSAYLKIGNSGS